VIAPGTARAPGSNGEIQRHRPRKAVLGGCRKYSALELPRYGVDTHSGGRLEAAGTAHRAITPPKTNQCIELGLRPGFEVLETPPPACEG